MVKVKNCPQCGSPHGEKSYPSTNFIKVKGKDVCVVVATDGSGEVNCLSCGSTYSTGDEVPAKSSTTIVNTGRGAVAVGDGATAAGAGGIAIRGNVYGGIVIEPGKKPKLGGSNG